MKKRKTYENPEGKDNERVLLLLQRSRSSIQRIIFSRTVLLLLMIFFQIGLLVLAALYLWQYLFYSLMVYWAFSAILITYIVSRGDNINFQIGWIVPIALLPVFGALFYLFINLQYGRRRIKKRQKSMIEGEKKYDNPDESVLEELSAYPGAKQLARYVNSVEPFPTCRCGQTAYYPTGEEFLEALLPELEKAEHFIFMEYFIIQEGTMWGRILSVLEEKVRQGVEVRVMYDGMCMFDKLPYFYPKELRAIGIKCKIVQPLRPFLSSRQNNRDHRKILVIDGRIAFTGGVNFADEYINQKNRFGYWKDNAVMVSGDAVASFTRMFLHMWNTTEKDVENFAPYLLTPHAWKDSWKERDLTGGDERTEGYVMPYGDSPFNDESLAENIYLDIINRAERYVHIMTPYLVLSQEMRTALCYAAKRGVEIDIIMPHTPDKKTAFCLAQTYYEELLEAGVHIYEFMPGFVHSKTFSSDGEKAVVGSINLDFRSLYLHYECAAYFFKAPVVEDIERDMQDTLKECREITMEDVKKRGLFVRIFGAVMRLVAPMM